MIRNIIFDFDGVIVDSEVLASRAFSVYFNNLGHSLKEEEFYCYAGMKTIEVIERLSEKYQINDKKKFSDSVFEIVSNIYLKDLQLVEGVESYIKESKLNHYIGSNSTKNRIIDGLKIVGLSNIFTSNKIYSFDMVEKPKPNPDIYLKVIRDNDLHTNETVVIEDSGVGVKAANLAGLTVFGLTAGKHWHSNRNQNELYDQGALNVFNNYKDLQKALEGL